MEKLQWWKSFWAEMKQNGFKWSQPSRSVDVEYSLEDDMPQHAQLIYHYTPHTDLLFESYEGMGVCVIDDEEGGDENEIMIIIQPGFIVEQNVSNIETLNIQTARSFIFQRLDTAIDIIADQLSNRLTTGNSDVDLYFEDRGDYVVIVPRLSVYDNISFAKSPETMARNFAKHVKKTSVGISKLMNGKQMITALALTTAK
jgi:hypothetical protein